MEFQSAGWHQYLIVAGAFLILIALKYFSLRRVHNKNLQGFVNIDDIMPDLQKKLKDTKIQDLKTLLHFNLDYSLKELKYLRNLAAITRYLKIKEVEMSHEENLIRKKFDSFKKQDLTKPQSLYIQYIQNQLEPYKTS